MSRELVQLVDQLSRPNVLVIGDLMIDRYTYGSVDRVSPEAPIPVLCASRRENRLGGAANVCQVLAGLEAVVDVAGAVGADENGELMRRMLAEAGVREAAVVADAARQTTVKERFVGVVADRHAHQILRVDQESAASLAANVQHDLHRQLLSKFDRYQAVIISDYNKGVCAPRLLRAVIQAANERSTPIVVDPMRGRDYARYRRATVLTPNGVEAEIATGNKIQQPLDALRLGQSLCDSLKVQAAAVTLGCEGIALALADGGGRLFPTKPRRVYDVAGAGDVVAAVIALCLADGAPLSMAIQLANIGGGLEVERFGAVAITRDEMRRELIRESGGHVKIVTINELPELGERYRSDGKRIVFTNGCFDLLHAGHVSYLQESSTVGDVLVVGINSDASVSRLKGHDRPVIRHSDRATVLAALACVDHVVIFDEDTPHEVLRRLRPDVLIKGGTYRPDEVIGREVVLSYGGKVLVTSAVEGVSTSKIIGSLQSNADEHPAQHASTAAQSAS